MMVLAGCQDEVIVQPQKQALWAGNGELVSLSIPISAPMMGEQVSGRALDDAGERNVQDLFVALFPINDTNNNGQVDPGEIGDRLFGKYYTVNELRPVANEPEHFNAGVVEVLNVPNGTYYIVGVANVNFGAHSGLRGALENADTWEKLHDVDVQLSMLEGQPVNIDRNTPALCMSGYYHDKGYVDSTDPDAEITPHPVTITQSGQLDGYIHLRRVDARIKFQIINEIPNCTGFALNGWKLYNVPAVSHLFEEIESDSTDLRETANRRNWTRTPATDTEKETYTFEFYQYENKGASKKPITKYREREAEEKINDGRDQDGHNYRDINGNREYTHYINAPKHSSFLLLDAQMEQEVTENGQTFTRTANMQYVIHLGYCEDNIVSTAGGAANKANDFNTRRNTKYTYIVRIIGVNDIIVEAQAEVESPAFNNGAEGTVVDMIGGQIEQLDTHFGVFNTTLTRREIRDMQLYITSAAGQWNSINHQTIGAGMTAEQLAAYMANPENFAPYPNYMTEDYQSIRIAPLGNRDVETELISYSETYDYDWPSTLTNCPTTTLLQPMHGEKKIQQDDTHTVPIYDLISFKRTYGSPGSKTNPNGYVDESESTAAGHLDEPLHFTVFVNEYYYFYDKGVIPSARTLGTDGTIASGDVVKPTMWQSIANTGHRKFMILSNAADSPDNDSHHVKGKLQIEQRAIQTYYSNLVTVGVALEHINEHHWKLMTENYGRTGDGHGWKAAWQSLVNQGESVHAEGGKTWGIRADQTRKLGEGYPAFATYSRTTAGNGSNYIFKTIGNNTDNNFGDKWTNRTGYLPHATSLMDRNYYEVIDACLSRNRDLNRDGKITADELRWYVPYINQYVDFQIGQGALETKLFNIADTDPALYGNEQVYSNRRSHYIASNRQHIWSEEGTSTGGAVQGWEIRCCRIIGAEDYANNLSLATPYEYDAFKRLFNTSRFADLIHRGHTSGAIFPHHNLELESNALAYYFQMSKTEADSIKGIIRPRPGESSKMETLHSYFMTNSFCDNYYENDDKSDIHTWRAPNQMEMALMFYGAGIRPPSGYQYLTSTYWWKNTDTYTAKGRKEGVVANQQNDYMHYMGANGSNLRMLHAGQDLGYSLIVRCVRDTDPDGNPAGSPEFGNPINFTDTGFLSTYTGDRVNMTVKASMSTSAVIQSVTIAGVTASNTGTGNVTSVVADLPITKTNVDVVWKIRYNGQTLTYRRTYKLPARYWVFSRYGVDKRYAYVDVETGRTAVGNVDNRNMDALEAVYKWVLTKDPTGQNPVSESELNTTDTYYMWNAGSQNYVVAPTSGTIGYLTMGATNPVPVKLVTTDRSGYLSIRINNQTWINSSNGVASFGTWSGYDDGSKYLLSPAVMKGEMPLLFTFAADYVVSGSGYSVSIETNPEAVIGNVTIGGLPATVTGSNGHYTASVSGTLSGTSFETVWNVTKGTDTFVRRKTYGRHVSYYVISSETGPQQYAYADGTTNRTAADAAPYTGDVENLDANHQWIFTTTKTATGVEPVNVNVFNDLSATYYMYNKGTGKYINGPLDTSTFGYLTIGEAEDRMKVKVESRSGGRYSFQFSVSGINNHCITTYRRNGSGWLNDPAVFGIFQTGGRDNAPYRFNLLPVYE